jgi:hypothetical protein
VAAAETSSVFNAAAASAPASSTAAAVVSSRLQTRQDYCYNPPKISIWSAAVW